MVDFSTQSTNISAPNLSGASFVNPGVVNKSAAMRTGANTALLGAVGEQAIDAYKSSQIGEMNTLTQDVVQEYMNRRDNPELAKGSLSEAAATDVSSSIFGNQQNISAVEAAQKERLATYRQALEEGVMSPDEFSDRVMSNLRETTNKNPGLYKELKEEAARILELSGITGIIKSDALIAESKQKQVEKAMSDMQERAKREHIYYDTTTLYWDLADKVQKAEGETRSFDMQVRNKDKFAMLSTEQSRQWIENKGDDVVRGSLSNTNNQLLAMVEELGVNSITYPKVKAQFEGSLDNMHQVFISSIPVAIRQEPVVQEKIKSHSDGIEKIKVRLSNLATGEDVKKVLSNEVDILKFTQQKELRKQYNVDKITLMGDMLRGVPGVIMESTVRERYTGIISAIAGESFDAPIISEIRPKSDKDTTSETIVNSAISAGKSSGDFTAFKRTMDAVNRETVKIENPQVRVQFIFNNLSAIAKQDPLKMDADSISKVEGHIKLLLNDTSFGLPTLAETTKDRKVKIDVLPSGQLIFVGEDAGKFNAAYGSNINMALRAYANSHGVTMEQAKKTFYPQYFGPFITLMADKDIK